ncbi:hypothetical protein [Nitrosomonas nitrosa]|nr:hypothetical protein [Nitrosomonas nitrosa]
MKRIIAANMLIFCAFILVGCASPEMKMQRKQSISNYISCIANKSTSLDDGVSSMGDIANGAILLCSSKAEAVLNEYGIASLDSKRKLSEGAYTVAIIEITNNRKKMASNQKPINCTMRALHDSCYKAGYARKSEIMCSEISESMRNVSSKSIADKAALMAIETLCYQWCANGIYDKPVESPEELCK